MKTTFALAVLALFLAPVPCFALWGVVHLTPAEAQNMGIEVVVTGNPEAVNVVVEFNLDDALKEFEGAYLEINLEGDSVISVPMREERKDEGHVTFSFYAHRDQLDTLSVQIRVPGELGGTIYELPIVDFVD